MQNDAAPLHVAATKPEGPLATRLEALGIAVEPITEDEGNVDRYVISKRLAVERRTASRFVAGIMDKSLFISAIYLREHFSVPVLIVQGKVDYDYRMLNPQAVRGALTAMMTEYGLSVLSTEDEEETAHILAMMVRQEQLGVPDISLIPKRKAADLPDQQRRVVEMLPGVGMALARDLLQDLGSIRRIVNATPEQLQTLRGVGPKKAKEIRRVANAEYDAVDTERQLEDAIEADPSLLFDPPVEFLLRQHLIFTDERDKHVVDMVFYDRDANELILVELKRRAIRREHERQIKRYIDHAPFSPTLRGYVVDGASVRGVLASVEPSDMEPSRKDIAVVTVDKARVLAVLRRLRRQRLGEWPARPHRELTSTMTANRFATYQDAMDFLFEAVDYEKLTRYKYDLPTFDLDRVRRFLAAVGSPQDAFRCVHVAGTKGKGSTATMVAAILRQAGYKVGLFTSPHMVDLEERVVVDGRKIDKADTVALLWELSDYVRGERRDNPELSPTFFEIITAMAFLHFQRVGVDYAVVEVGLGGRLDATNVIEPDACAITTIGFDHVNKLGHTLEAIAGEKAGIVKPGVPVVTAVDQPGALGVIEAKCREQGADLFRVDEHVRLARCEVVREGDRVGTAVRIETWTGAPVECVLPVLGRHQARNAAVAVGVARALEQRGAVGPLGSHVMAEALSQLELAGRAQIVGHDPTMVLDGAHTVESARALMEAIGAYVPHECMLAIVGISRDKDVDGILREVLPCAAMVVFSKSDSPRAVPPETLAERARAVCGKESVVVTDPAKALQVARDAAAPGDVICVTGSFYLAGKIREALDAEG